MTQPAPWPARLTRQVAGEIKRWRDARGLSAQQLADACETLGHPVPRSVIANLESGRRETITVAELLILARALEVPAVQLVFPLGSTEKVEALPGQEVSTEAAMQWLTGWYDLFRDESDASVGHGNQSPEGLHEWYETPFFDASAPIHFYDEHRRLVQEYADAYMETLRRFGDSAPDHQIRIELGKIRKRSEDAIRAKRAEMRRRGMTVLPDLPPELEHLR